jgi:hypothetical protein
MSASPSNFSLYKRGSHYHILYYLHGKRRWKLPSPRLLCQCMCSCLGLQALAV